MPSKPKNPVEIIHYLMYGKVACGKFVGKRPAEWPPLNMFDIHWKNVTCKECLKQRPRETTKEQYDILRHTLGLQKRDNENVRPFRNKYVDEPDSEVPNQLVRKSMMVKSEPVETFGGMCVYQATNFGKAVALKPIVIE